MKRAIILLTMIIISVAVAADNPDTPDLVCRDSDFGQDVYVYGFANTSIDLISDYCIDDNTVNEAICILDNVSYVELDCPTDHTCSDGRCISSATCRDFDGFDLLNRSSASGLNSEGIEETLNDYCVDAIKIMEATCDPDTVVYEEHYCPEEYLCQLGACIDGRDEIYSITAEVHEGWNLLATNYPFFEYASHINAISAALLYMPIDDVYLNVHDGIVGPEADLYNANLDYLTLAAQWIYFEESGFITYNSNIVIPDNNTNGEPYLQLHAGWNLMTIPAQLSEGTLDFGDCNVLEASAWDARDQVWIDFLPEEGTIIDYILDNAFDMVGYGISVNVAADCSLANVVGE